MTPAATFFIVLVAVMAVLFITEKLPIELTALAGLLVLLFAGFVTPEQAFVGFSSPVVLTLVSVFILSAALRESGVTDRLVNVIYRLVGNSEALCVLAVAVTAAFFSSFMNNIAAVVLLLPSVLSLASRTQVPPSLLMIPLSFSAMLGGMTTLLGTSPNLLASDALRAAGLEPFGFFAFTPIGLGITALGILFISTVGWRMLPRNTAFNPRGRGDDLIKLYQVFEQVFSVKVPTDRSWSKTSLADTHLGSILGAQVLAIVRGGRRRLAPRGSDILEAGDILVIAGNLNQFLALKEHFSNSSSEYLLADRQVDVIAAKPLMMLEMLSDNMGAELESLDVGVAEMMMAPRSSLIGQSIRNANFRERYGCQVLSIWRSNTALKEAIGDQEIQLGDALLLQGPRARINMLSQDADFLLLNQSRAPIVKRYGALVAAIAFIGMVLTSASGLLTIEVAALSAAVFVMLTGVLPVQQAYREIEWRVVIFMAALLPLGVAVQSTGLASLAAQWLVQASGSAGAWGTLIVLALCASFVSQVLDGTPTIVFLAPIALSVAAALGVKPQPFLIAIAMGASIAFLTPFSHKAHLVVMNPGGYCARDYLRVGAWISLICFVGLFLLLKLFIPL